MALLILWGVPIAIALLRVSTSMIILGAPMMTLGCLAAGCYLADSPITAGANWTCSVGLLSSLALMVPMTLSTCSDGADLIGPCAAR